MATEANVSRGLGGSDDPCGLTWIPMSSWAHGHLAGDFILSPDECGSWPLSRHPGQGAVGLREWTPVGLRGHGSPPASAPVSGPQPRISRIGSHSGSDLLDCFLPFLAQKTAPRLQELVTQLTLRGSAGSTMERGKSWGQIVQTANPPTPANVSTRTDSRTRSRKPHPRDKAPASGPDVRRSVTPCIALAFACLCSSLESTAGLDDRAVAMGPKLLSADRRRVASTCRDATPPVAQHASELPLSRG
ncbi:hypothetical protein MAPG_02066 [Magnaporthiopsis poae ATCC 64411]|uniref:Uncharacterized protein n=1 Tax=Magnaporthiopsis poae (strain ATCC 64411 / 73-15) TaxID=644358 RepID=A0A0C4DQC7_MAGP6|nr:hypothetical protein MAPG_02066 [Magnaporthiopsis poae ATCC 64411]